MTALYNITLTKALHQRVEDHSGYDEALWVGGPFLQTIVNHPSAPSINQNCGRYILVKPHNSTGIIVDIAYLGIVKSLILHRETLL